MSTDGVALASMISPAFPRTDHSRSHAEGASTAECEGACASTRTRRSTCWPSAYPQGFRMPSSRSPTSSFRRASTPSDRRGGRGQSAAGNIDNLVYSVMNAFLHRLLELRRAEPRRGQTPAAMKKLPSDARLFRAGCRVPRLLLFLLRTRVPLALYPRRLPSLKRVLSVSASLCFVFPALGPDGLHHSPPA